MEITPINVRNQMWSIQLGDLGRMQTNREGLPIGAIPAAEKTDFGSMVAEELNKVNSQLNASDKTVSEIAEGKSENIHGALIAMQKANLSFKMLVEVRNKALEAYQELMRMQA